MLRFPIGTRVMARCPNRGCSLYHPGVVVALYPFPRIPYRVMLDKGDTAYAEVDRDFCIYREQLALPLRRAPDWCLPQALSVLLQFPPDFCALAKLPLASPQGHLQIGAEIPAMEA